MINQRLDLPSLRPAASSGMTSKVGIVGQKVRGTLTAPGSASSVTPLLIPPLGSSSVEALKKKKVPATSEQSPPVDMLLNCFEPSESSMFKVRCVMCVNQVSIAEDTEKKSLEDISFLFANISEHPVNSHKLLFASLDAARTSAELSCFDC